MNTPMKYIGGITAAVALTATLTACASTPSTQSTTSTTRYVASTTTTKAPSKSTNTDTAVRLLQQRFPGASRSEVIDIAQQACVVIDEAGSVAQAIRGIIMDDEIDADMAGDMSYVMGIAVPIYCPEYLYELEQIVG